MVVVVVSGSYIEVGGVNKARILIAPYMLSRSRDTGRIILKFAYIYLLIFLRFSSIDIYTLI